MQRLFRVHLSPIVILLALITLAALSGCVTSKDTVYKIPTTSYRNNETAKIIVLRGVSFIGSGVGFYVLDPGDVIVDRNMIKKSVSYFYNPGKHTILTSDKKTIVSLVGGYRWENSSGSLIDCLRRDFPSLPSYITDANLADYTEKGLQNIFVHGVEIGVVGMNSQLEWERAPGKLTIFILSKPPFGASHLLQSETITVDKGNTYTFKIEMGLSIHYKSSSQG